MCCLPEQNQGNVWIGANDKVEENKFVWNDETTAISYEHFNSEQPNGGSDHNCVIIRQRTGLWHDNKCNDVNVLRRPLCRKC